ncbi:acetylxylan esterase [Arcticibacter sp.]|uniref:glucuronyl esterase domain-containing protein n=1 Tax=Arcticibacter sp. TaxID=1872630 RepID=UPI00388F653D
MKNCVAAVLVLLGSLTNLQAQNGINYDESKVPDYVLPELLTSNAGTRITNKQQWEKIRRPELLETFSSQMYGRTPNDKIKVSYTLLDENKNDLNGKATRRQVKFTFSNGSKSIDAILLMYIPNQVKGKVPVIIGYNFKGNHSTHKDSSILYSPALHLVKEPTNPDWVRGCQATRWAFDDIIDRGYAIATMCYHDIFPDKKGLKDHSIVSLFSNYNSNKSDEWQAIGAWAWGSSRIMDYLETQKEVDTKKSVLMGHSRQGKAALWAGAQDTRFKIVISNDSGEGGAALSKRFFGETIEKVSNIPPAWFAPAYSQYANNEAKLPFDQHELIALIAPRPVYVASAEEDLWADPKGEFLGAYHAGPAYALYGLKGLGTTTMPGIHQPIMNDVGYHIRAGKHDVTQYDWTSFMNFADKHFK